MTAEKKQNTEAKKTRRRTKKDAEIEVQAAEQAAVEVPAAVEEAPAAVESAPAEDLPDVPENERIHRYDVVITSERAGYKPPKAALGAMVQQLAFRGFANPVDEAIAENWVEVYFEPGPAAHEIFIEKEYNSAEPAFKEIVVKVYDKPFVCDFSETPKRPLYWAIEIRGSRFKAPIGSFRKLFLEAFNLRIAVCSCDAQPMPPHRIVPEDERPVEKKRRERGAGLAGVNIEEA